MTSILKRTDARDRAIEAVADIDFRDWGVLIGGQEGNDLYLQVSFSAPDSLTGEPAVQGGRKWRLSKHMTRSEIVQTALAAVLAAVEHEAREDFRYRGVAIFGPHHDVDSLLCVGQDVRA